MNSITQSILANQATESAKVLEQKAAEARQLAVIEDSKARCDALIREFNESPIGLTYYSLPGETALSRRPSLNRFAVPRSSDFIRNLGTFVKLGVRVYLVWGTSTLYVAYNAEAAHALSCDSVRGKVGPEFSTAHHAAIRSTKLMSLEETARAVRLGSGSNTEERAEVGAVSSDGKYTTYASDSKEDWVFSNPADFIGVIIKRMSPFLIVRTPTVEEPKKAKKGKK